MGKIRNVVSSVVLIGFVGAGVLLWMNRTAVADDFRDSLSLWNYSPPANIAALAGKIRFTAEGQRYFYVSHPEIDDKTVFNQNCGNTEVHTTILGCYTNYRIYVYNVTDSRLNGVQEVTAAHETLHAAYARLSTSERTRVDAMVQRQYDSMQGNADFVSRFAVYDKLSQADKLNELHSIFGTEVTPLSNELETYYRQYFQDRSVLTADYSAYQGQFTVLQTQQTALKSQIDTLQSDITAAKARYETDRSTLENDIAAFKQKANSGGYASQAQYNRDQAALSARVDALNASAEAINTMIDKRTDLINQYNALSVQTEDLQNSLDSNSVQPAPSV